MWAVICFKAFSVRSFCIRPASCAVAPVILMSVIPPPVPHGFGFDFRHQCCCKPYRKIALIAQILVYKLCHVGHSKRIRVNQSYFLHFLLTSCLHFSVALFQFLAAFLQKSAEKLHKLKFS
jgi:hypothetical protein